jgi:hypothetical protein
MGYMEPDNADLAIELQKIYDSQINNQYRLVLG